MPDEHASVVSPAGGAGRSTNRLLGWAACVLYFLAMVTSVVFGVLEESLRRVGASIEPAITAAFVMVVVAFALSWKARRTEVGRLALIIGLSIGGLILLAAMSWFFVASEPSGRHVGATPISLPVNPP